MGVGDDVLYSEPFSLVLFNGFEFEGAQSPIYCELLNRVEQVGFSDFASGYLEDVLALENEMSKLVE